MLASGLRSTRMWGGFKAFQGPGIFTALLWSFCMRCLCLCLFSCNVINFYDFCCGLSRCRVPSGFRNFWVGMCRWDTSEPLAYTRARSSEFCYPILDLTPKIPPPPHPRVAVFQKLLRSQTQSSQNKTDLIFFMFLSGNSRYGFPSLD